MQSPLFGILGINNNHPRQPTLLVNKEIKDSSPAACAYPAMNLPCRLADAEEKKEQEKESKLLQAPKKQDNHS